MRCTGLIKVAALLGCILFSLSSTAQDKDGSGDPTTARVSQTVETLLSDPGQAARITSGEADKVAAELPEAFPGVKKYDLLDQAYKALKPQVHQQPEHALKARLLAALARTSRQRTTDIAEAEQLDLLLNPDQPDAWLRRGISYAKMKEEKWAADMFLEGLRRTDFARPPEFFSTLAPPTAGWVPRISRAKRTDELNSALADAFARTKEGAANSMAFAMLQAVLDVEDTPLHPQRLALLLKSVREHQQHLLFTHVAQLRARIDDWNDAGHQGAATTLARAILLTPVGTQSRVEIPAHQEMTADFLATALWGQKPWTVDSLGLIPSLMTVALREPHAEFFVEGEAAMAKHATDPHLISCMLLARAMVSPLGPEALQSAQGLDPASRLRVAWRLSALAPEGRVEPRLLAPWIAEGLPALLRAPDEENGVGANLRQAMQMLPWLEKAGQSSSLPALVPLLREKLVKRGGSDDAQLNADLWPQLLVLAVMHGDAREREACAQAWRQSCQRRRKDIVVEWRECRHVVRVLVDAMTPASREQGRELARLAFQAWSAAWSRSVKEGESDDVVALAVLDALLSADLSEELGAFEKQILNELTFGAGGLYASILERIHSYRAITGADGRKLPPITATVHAPGLEGGSPLVAWSMELPLDYAERQRLEHMVDPELHLDALYRSPPLHALSGKFDVEVYAGESPADLKKIGGTEAVAMKGELPLKNLPSAGWVRLMVKNPRSGLVAMGESMAYCVREAELHSKEPPRGAVPVWPPDVCSEFGTPISGVTPIEQGMEYLVRMDQRTSWPAHLREPFPRGTQLVALDANRNPVAALGDMNRDDLFKMVGPAMAVIRPERWLAGDGQILDSNMHPAREIGVQVHHLVLTRLGTTVEEQPALRVQKFIQHQGESAPTRLPTVDAEFLAPVEMEARTWFVSNIRPRAAVGGVGGIMVYDTSMLPWGRLRRFESRALLGHESVFMFDDSRLFCLEWPCEGRPQAALRILPLDSDLAYEDHPRQVLPMNPASSEVAVDESGVIFIAPSEGAFRTKFRALWLGADGKLLETSTERPAMEGPSEVKVAWWGKDGTMGIGEGGRMFHLKVTPGALVVEKQESGIASFETVPAGAAPSSHLWQPRFVLKNPRLLLRLDQKTGEVLTGYWLPYFCTGSPIWMADENSPALLTTDQGELIRVQAPLVRKQ